MRRKLYRVALVVGIGVVSQELAGQDTAHRRAAINDKDASIAEHSLQLTASPLRTAVPVEGPLLVEVTVRSRSDSVVRFRPILDFGKWLDAKMVGPAGSPLPRTASIDPPNRLAVSLETGESITDTVDLRCSLPVPEEDWCMAPYDFSRPGVYELKMHFTLPCDFEACDELVKVEAKAFTIQVQDVQE